MEFLLCFALAALFTGGRSISEIIHAAKGTEPPHVARARLKAERAGAPRSPSRKGFRNYLKALWHDAWDDAKQHHDRARQEKQAGARPTRAQRAKRLGQTIWRGYGDPPPLPVASPLEPAATEPAKPAPAAPAAEDAAPEPAVVVCPRCKQQGDHFWKCCSVRGRNTDRHYCCPDDCELGPDEPAAETREAPNPPTNGGPPMTAPTGEVTNYEQTVAELEALIKEQQANVDSSQAMLDAIQAAKMAANNMEQTYRTSAAAAANIADGLAAKNLDSTTQAHAGTVVDALPPNAMNQTYDALEEIEAQVRQLHHNAEVALASAEAELKHVIETYGESHANVAQNLGGDASFLDSGGSAAGAAAMANVDGQAAAADAAVRHRAAGDAANNPGQREAILNRAFPERGSGDGRNVMRGEMQAARQAHDAVPSAPPNVAAGV